ncbi:MULTISPECIES: thiosulfate sulfurtransferase GlpE [Pasteurellaceae]|uniref:Thiosulfate sulfurtransferase GlpE n=1 Tax=Pasteurella atlantica TaxID=2827233 RepID=A0AAW8CS19_9PAST|nr:thiosulfate sulfurtransferase GlpE [Pasteurella atlantica]MBR0574322.1 thiosulfate sulfurtransferase GlpE [Pasteurella atlantica]MDP8040226.1 thiosulfate sulfurtransferase GlpE [Pasteurella atlantica]MDP8042335.1 thiosulfate sulfurtransferase GlpE [Pasteurella atlantica]MDP8044528.1 thiosulfate sulfurtransferase GlpE [Pasteurella atlantica]MDP8046540.1 thiosulfate sulfurtransferase GlpE [Pasteurella atlantica]
MNTFTEISPEQAWEKIENNTAIIVDTRDRIRYEQSHPKTAFHLTNQSYGQFLDNYDYDQHIMVLCYHGISSRNTAQFLVEQGFDNVYSITGGFEAWQKAALPTETRC